MADESTKTVLHYESDESRLYRGTYSPFRDDGLKPGTSKHMIPHAIETLRVLPDSAADFGKSVYFSVPQRDVLLGKQTLSFILPQLTVYSASTGDYIPFQWPTVPACAIVESVDLFIDSVRIDKITGEHLYIIMETDYSSESKYITARTNAGEDNSSGFYLTTMFGTSAIEADSTKRTKSSRRLYLPLDFWFGDHGNELPNIGTIRFRVNFRDLRNVVTVSGGVTADTVFSTTVGTEIMPQLSEVEVLLETFWVTDSEKYDFLKEDRIMPMRCHYTLTLPTKTNGGIITARTEYIPKPIKDIRWVVQNESVLRNMGNVYHKYTGGTGDEEFNLMETATIYANSSKIQETMPSEHFNTYVPMIHGLRVPASGIYMFVVSDVPVDIGNAGTLSRSLGFKMTTQTGVGDLSARIFVNTFSHYSIRGGEIEFSATI